MMPGDAGGVVAGIVGVLAVCATALAVDTEPTPARDTITIQVTAVQAGRKGDCDPRLEKLRSRLRRVVGYKSFEVLGDDTREVVWQDSQEFPLPGGRQLILVPRGREAAEVLLQVRLLDGRRRLVDTVVRLQNRGMMVFGVEPDHEGGDPLLIVLRAED